MSVRGPGTRGQVSGDGELATRRTRRRRRSRGTVNEAVTSGLGARHQVGRVVFHPSAITGIF